MDYKHRDSTFIKINKEQYLAIACDSCGAIGLKENDMVKLPCNIAGKYTTRVCLMEILSIGAKPIGLTVNICNEFNPTGREILRGIKDELDEAGVNIPITISTEKNMKTSMTALGITIIGIVDRDDIIINKISKGDYIYSIGIPSVGNEVLENKGLISDIKVLNKILSHRFIKEVIPVGSSGIKGELNKLCEYLHIKLRMEDDIQVDINKSAGPCTAIIVICKDELKNDLKVPINIIGKVI